MNSAPAFTCAGLRVAFEVDISEHEVRDDQEGEAEANVSADWKDAQDISPDDPEYNSVVEAASCKVTTLTDKGYRRLMGEFENWLKSHSYIASSSKAFEVNVDGKMPEYICMWIMSKCDELDLEGNTKPADEVRASFSYAMKMRASLTYGFGRLRSRGIQEWRQCRDGTWQGNPSISSLVSCYMVSLRRRTVRRGDLSMSSRAITPDVLKAMWKFNRRPENWDIARYTPGKRDAGPDIWGKGRARRCVQCVYLLAFWCLLRIDEALNIQVHDISIVSATCMKVSLPFRKTHQFGGIKPFFLYLLPQAEAWMCPVRAFAQWQSVSGVTSGYLFRRVDRTDRIHHDKHLTAAKFLEMFRQNLLDVGKDSAPYGTHSFRRGGCQWLATGKRWPMRRICDWAGWSPSSNNTTIMRYLLSWNDDPLEPREELLNPNRAPAVRCYSCGRTCHCG